MLIVTFVRICVFNRCGVIDIVRPIACVGLAQPLSIVGCFVALIFEVILSYRLPSVYNLFVLQLVIEKTIDTADKELYLTFIDYRKAPKAL